MKQKADMISLSDFVSKHFDIFGRVRTQFLPEHYMGKVLYEFNPHFIPISPYFQIKEI